MKNSTPVATHRSDRVKSLDFHPKNPWLAISLFTGYIQIYDYEQKKVLNTFECTPNRAVRSAKFVPRKQWLIATCDDGRIRVFNYNTLEKIKDFQAHTDYIRSLAIHPVKPIFLSCSDDKTISMWNWDRGFDREHLFLGHNEMVMQVTFDPNNPDLFGSCSMDKTIKIWSLSTKLCKFTLNGHLKGVNSIAFYPDQPYLVSGADDYSLRIWDLQNKSTIATLKGHTANITSVLVSPDLPVLFSTGEDGDLRIWDKNNYEALFLKQFQFEKAWNIAALRNTNLVAIGFDMGTVVLKFGSNDPIYDMDKSGNILTFRNSTIYRMKLKDHKGELHDGDPLDLTPVLKTVDHSYSKISFSSNGRYVATFAPDREYPFTIWFPRSWRSQTFGTAIDFAWGVPNKTFSSIYATLTSETTIQIHKMSRKRTAETGSTWIASDPFTVYQSQKLFGGPLLSAVGTEYITLYDWKTCALVTSLAVKARFVVWSDNNRLVAIVGDSKFFILRFDPQVMKNATKSESGIPGVLTIEYKSTEKISTGTWTNNTFIFSTSSRNDQKLKCLVVGPKGKNAQLQKSNKLAHLAITEDGLSSNCTIRTIALLDRPYYILGYSINDLGERCYLMDHDMRIISYSIPQNQLQFESFVLNGQIEQAKSIKLEDPKAMARASNLLLSQGFPDEALALSQDPEQKFSFAYSLENYDLCLSVLKEAGDRFENLWAQLGMTFLQSKKPNVQNAIFCLHKAHDWSNLLLIYSSNGNKKGVTAVAIEAARAGLHNIAFSAFSLISASRACFDLLILDKRFSEAASFARNYLPSQINNAVTLWKAYLVSQERPYEAESILSPELSPSSFPNHEKNVAYEKSAIAKLLINPTTLEEFLSPDFSRHYLNDLSTSTPIEIETTTVSEVATTVDPTTVAPTTVSATTIAPTTVSATTVDSTTVASTTTDSTIDAAVDAPDPVTTNQSTSTDQT